MSSITGLINSGSLKHIKLLHVLIVTGALAAVGLLSNSELRSANSGSSSAPELSTGQLAVESAPVTMLVYIVRSQAEKDVLDRDALPAGELSEAGITGQTIVIEGGTEESLGLLAELLPLAGLTTGHGAKLTLVDLR